MATQVEDLMAALKLQLSHITTANGYSTNIGALINLHSAQRGQHDLPSIAIGMTTGRFNRTNETSLGRQVSAKARSVDFTLEAAHKASPEDAMRIGLDMLEDIEVAMSKKTGLAPYGTSDVTLETWQVLDRPEGVDGVVLQILGTAGYLRA